MGKAVHSRGGRSGGPSGFIGLSVGWMVKILGEALTNPKASGGPLGRQS